MRVMVRLMGLVCGMAMLGACAPVGHVAGAWEVRGKPSVFSGATLPGIEVVPPRDERGRAERFAVSARFFDAGYADVTAAREAGRYGAIVEVATESGWRFRRFVTLFRSPRAIDWEGARMEVSGVRLPAELGILPEAVAREHAAVSEFFKYALQDEIDRGPGGEDTQAAAMLAGLYEAGKEGAAATRPFVAREGYLARDQRWWFGLKRKVGVLGLPYLLWMPGTRSEDGGWKIEDGARKSAAAPSSILYSPSSQPHPLILFLHGSGECGDGGPELAKVLGNGLARMLASGKGLPADFPFVVVMPQCPRNQYWSPYELAALLDEVEAKYDVDPDRVYLTGLSLGGYGVWDAAIAFPDRFAAIAPVAGAGDPADAERIKHVPAWVFHGDKDPIVPVDEARRMVEALHAAGADEVHLTVYPGVGHDSWTKAYAGRQLYDWFLHRRVAK